MSLLVQNLIALMLVAACTVYVAWQLLRSVRAGNGKAGSCCSKGCNVLSKAEQQTPRAGEQFIASDSLRRKRV